MYRARFSAIYEPEGGEEVALVRYEDALPEEAEFEWELNSDELNYIGAAYGEDVPTGNARYKMTLHVLREYPTVAQLEASMLEEEQRVALRRVGHMRLLRGYHNGVPTHRQRWRATLTGVGSRLICDAGEAWGEAHEEVTLRGKANGVVWYEFTLTEPQDIEEF